jgi:uncharacterized protein YjbJ (UPF0337 family)
MPVSTVSYASVVARRNLGRGVGVTRRVTWTSEETNMADKDSGPEAGVKGIVEDLKGKLKTAAGSVTGNEDLEQEGHAQQQKAEAERDVARKEAEAEGARAEAGAHEAEQRARQS